MGRFTQLEIIEKEEEIGTLSFKNQSIFSLINNLKDKKLIAEVGFARSGKAYGHLFLPTMSRAEYYARMIDDRLTDKEVVELKRALRRALRTIRKEETTAE